MYLSFRYLYLFTVFRRRSFEIFEFGRSHQSSNNKYYTPYYERKTQYLPHIEQHIDFERFLWILDKFE